MDQVWVDRVCMDRELVISAIRELVAEHGVADVSRAMIIARLGVTQEELALEFGCWDALFQLAGLPPGPSRRVAVTREDLLERLRELVAARGVNVSLVAFKRETGFSERVILGRWGKWSKLREAAGLPRFAKVLSRYSEEDLLQDLWQVYRRTGRPPMKCFHKRDGGEISSNTICGYFGGWEEVKQAFEAYRRKREKRGKR